MKYKSPQVIEEGTHGGTLEEPPIISGIKSWPLHLSSPPEALNLASAAAVVAPASGDVVVAAGENEDGVDEALAKD